MSELSIRVGAGQRVVELSHPMRRGMPNHSSHPAYDLVPYYRHGDFMMDGGYGGANELLLLSGHSGTHLDSLGHVTRDGVGFGGVPASDLGKGLDGLAYNGIDTVQPVIRRGVLLDFVSHRGPDGDIMAPITADDVLAVSEAQGTPLEEGDAVLIGTGWSSRWEDPETYMGTPNGSPGIDVSAASLLADRGAFLIGGESAVVEHQAPGSHALPVHMTALVDRGVHLLENMNLVELAETGVREFVFIALPLRLVGATGSPVRAIAVLP